MKMLEKIARASFKCWRDRMTELGHHLDKKMNFEDMSESELEFAFMNARAMVEAMKEPTDIMKLEIDKTTNNMSEPCSNFWFEECYTAMLDAILNEK